MNGEPTGFSPHSKEVAQHLNHLSDHYEGMPDGYLLATTLLQCDTSTSSGNEPKSLEPMQVHSTRSLATRTASSPATNDINATNDCVFSSIWLRIIIQSSQLFSFNGAVPPHGRASGIQHPTECGIHVPGGMRRTRRSDVTLGSWARLEGISPFCAVRTSRHRASADSSRIAHSCRRSVQVEWRYPQRSRGAR